MIETRVRVLSAEPGKVWVETTEHNGCGACASKESCGISGLGRVFSRRRAPISIACGDAQAGQELTVCVSEAGLLKAALWAYILPALLAVLGAALMSIKGDTAAVLGMAAGLVIGLVIARLLARHPDIFVTSGETP